MNKIIIPVLASIILLGTLATGLTPNAYAAQGEIVWINPPGKLGKIAEDGCSDKRCYHPFQIPKDLADSDYIPQVGDSVTFDSGPGNTASNVEKIPEGKTVELIVTLEDGSSVSGASCEIVARSPVGAVVLNGRADVDGKVVFELESRFTHLSSIHCGIEGPSNFGIEICATLPLNDGITTFEITLIPGAGGVGCR